MHYFATVAHGRSALYQQIVHFAASFINTPEAASNQSLFSALSLKLPPD
jgi:hypothetical protein